MHITHCATVAELNEKAADLIVSELNKKPQSLLCTATGNSPTGIYQLLAERKSSIDSKSIRLLKLDEWYGLPMDHPASCEYYLQKYLIGPLGINSVTSFDSKAEPEAECKRINGYLAKNGPIDICVLGLGQNGHLGFNEPADFLHPHAHLATLSETSVNHPMIKGSGVDMKYGFTLGLADILQSRKIILPVFGQNKRAIMQRLMEGGVSTHLPASLLWLHGNTECLYCENDN
jgi:galactosamine-6-phosphate isomerase